MAQKSVGLVVITHIPGFGEPYALLHRRGNFNSEKMEFESYAGACQVTAHGKIETGESRIEALLREIREEIAHSWTQQELDYLASQLSPLYSDLDEDVFTYGLLVQAQNLRGFLDSLSLHAGTGGLVFLPRSQLQDVQELTREHKEEGVSDRREIRMFPDEIEAVLQAFEILAPE